MTYRYYLRNRPPSIGTHPNNPDKVEGYNPRQPAPISGYLSWGYVEYGAPLSNESIANYELFEDRVTMPSKVVELVKFAHDEGVNEAIETIFDKSYKEYGIELNGYLKTIGLLYGSRENIIAGFHKIAGM